MSETGQPDARQQIVRDITFQAAHAIEADRPLFLIVYYEHEALKIAFLKALGQALREAGLGTQTFDPIQRPEHGVGRLYPLLASTASGRTLALITGIPSPASSSDLAASFLDYLNLHRDQIERDKLRVVLLLHSSEAERFMAGAGDLWDFRHHTYWLEGMPMINRAELCQSLTETTTATNLTDQDKEAIVSHLQNARSLIDQTSEPEEQAALFLDLSRWLTRHHVPTLGAEIARAGLQLLAAGPSLLRSRLEHELGYALHKDHNNSDALLHYKNALAIQQVIGDRAGEGGTLNNISQIFKDWGRNDEALQSLEQSLTISREIGNPEDEWIALNNISQIYDIWGRYDEALKALEESLAISRKIGDRDGEGVTLNNISQIYGTWGRYDEALNALEESLAIRREIGDRAGEAGTLNNIAIIHDANGKYDEALKILNESLAIHREIGDRAGEGSTLNNISQIYYTWGRHDEALKALEESLAIHREIGNRAREGILLINIAGIYSALSRYKDALRIYEEGLAILREIGDRSHEGIALNNIAHVYLELEHYDEALNILKESQCILYEIGDMAGEDATCWNLALEYQRRGDLLNAIEFARRTIAIEEELHHPDAEKSREYLRQLEQEIETKDAP